jgi:adenylate cyclase
VGTFRTEEINSQNSLLALCRQLARHSLAQEINLPRLSYDAVKTILLQMSGAGKNVLPLAERLFRETEGNPFFLMEIIRALFESNTIQLKEGFWQGNFDHFRDVELPLPESLSEVVSARVKRLMEEVQAVLRLAAVLGREFNFDLLNAAYGKGEQATLVALDELMQQRLLEEKSGPHEPDFAFAHNKIQEVVYQGLSPRLRAHLHAKAGATIESIYADELDARASELAHHFEQACLLDQSLSNKAIAYLMKAGHIAVHQFANREAQDYYQRALTILLAQPETLDRMHQEVELQLAFAAPTAVIEGYTSENTKRIFDRAYELCQKLGETSDLFTSLVGLARYYGITGNMEIGSKLGKQLLTIARATGESDFLLEAYREMGGQCFSMGRFKKAREFWEAGLALSCDILHESHAVRFGHDPTVTCLGYLSITLWLMGYPVQAQEQCLKLRNLISVMTHPSSQAYAYCLLAMQAALRHAVCDACEFADAAIQLGRLYGIPSWTVLATTFKGWSTFEQGQVDEGLALLENGIRTFQGRGFAHPAPFLLGLQAQTYLKLRNPQDGLTCLNAALSIIRDGCDHCWEAELNRLYGELIIIQERDGRLAEGRFLQALTLSRMQEARMLELRAAMSLARLWHEQGRSPEARQMLSEIYDQFDEGFDSDDLRQAKSLLMALS